MRVPNEYGYRGRQPIAGLLLTEAQQSRIWEIWHPGCQVFRVDNTLWVRFATPRHADVRHQLGTPLVLGPDGVYRTHPGGTAPRGHLLIRQADHWTDRGPGTPWDPADQLEIETERVVLERLAPLPPAPEVVADLQEQVFDDVVGERVSPPAREAPGLFGRILASLLARSRPTEPATAPSEPGLVPPSSEPGLWDRMDHWLSSWAMSWGLGSFLGQAQADYIQKMLDDFASERFEEALRRGIPIGGGGAGEQLLSGLFAPTPRDDLAFGVSGGVSSTIPMRDRLQKRLQEAYEQAAASLERAGRIDEAAYVLGELLGRPMEAVALLEKHELYTRAAELARAKGLDPALAVRLHFLSGDIPLALALARQNNVSAQVLTELQRSNPEHARSFRLAWAATLAGTGRYAAATHLLGHEFAHTETAMQWMEAGTKAGGEESGKLLGMLIGRRPDALDALGPTLRSVLSGDDVAAREALGRQLVIESRTRTVQAALRATSRALHLDLAAQKPVDGDLLRSLRVAAQGAYAFDNPRSAMPKRAEGKPWGSEFAASDVGWRSIEDAWLAPNGRLFAALGEAGIVELDAQGHVLSEWAHPAHGFVSTRTSPLVITRRGPIHRVFELDLGSGELTHRADLTPSHTTGIAQGQWFVVVAARLHALDLASPTLDSIWSTPIENVQSIAVGMSTLGVFDGVDLRRYDINDQIVLRSRRTADVDSYGDSDDLWVTPTGDLSRWAPSEHGWTDRAGTVSLSNLRGCLYTDASRAAWSHNTLATGLNEPEWTATFHGSQQLSARWCGNYLIVFDELGRLVIADPSGGRIVRQHRL